MFVSRFCGDHNIGTAAGGTQRNGQPDAAAGASDEQGLAFE